MKYNGYKVVDDYGNETEPYIEEVRMLNIKEIQRVPAKVALEIETKFGNNIIKQGKYILTEEPFKKFRKRNKVEYRYMTKFGERKVQGVVEEVGKDYMYVEIGKDLIYIRKGNRGEFKKIA